MKFKKTIQPCIVLVAAPLDLLQQEVDSEVPEEEAKVEALVDLSELKELPILDIADAFPPEVLKPTSGQVLPSGHERLQHS